MVSGDAKDETPIVRGNLARHPVDREVTIRRSDK